MTRAPVRRSARQATSARALQPATIGKKRSAAKTRIKGEGAKKEKGGGMAVDDFQLPQDKKKKRTQVTKKDHNAPPHTQDGVALLVDGKKVPAKLLDHYHDSLTNPGDQTQAVEHLCRVDKRFKAEFQGTELPETTVTEDSYRALTVTVIYQQLASSACRAMLKKFLRCFDLDYDGPNHMPDDFPTPAQVLEYGPDRLFKNARLSGNKCKAIMDISLRFSRGDVSHAELTQLGATDKQIAAKLLGMRGLGPWSVDMFLMFSLRRSNILPTGDLGVKKGMQIWFGLKELPDADKMIQLAEPWEPYRSLGTWIMWRVANRAKLEAKAQASAAKEAKGK